MPVPETAGGHGAARTAIAAAALAALMSVAAAAPPVPAATQLPTGGTVVAGQGSLQSAGSTLTVNQSSTRAVINWQTFDLGSQASIVFNQAAGRAAATLNRVLDVNPSQVYGRIQAPGQVFISNPYGVIFGSGASVDVGGLTATSLSISNSDFMAGNLLWQRDGATGAVVNAGTLTAADGGYIALLAPEVRNEGVVVARAGTVALAAGETIRLDFGDNALLGIHVTPAKLQTLVENRHAVLAEGGLVILSARSADSLRSGVVNQAGSIDAGSLVARGGRVLLEGDDITLAAGSRTAASGATGGGQVLVGGGWQGSGDLHQASKVTLEAGARIDATAASGTGGEVVMWASPSREGTQTTVRGTIDVGSADGSGGRVETSGRTVDFAGAAITAAGTAGRGGLWLIDPVDITVDASSAATLSAALGNASAVLQTSASTAGAGNVKINGAISWSANTELTISAHHNIDIAAPITARGETARLTLRYGQGAVDAGNTSTYQIHAPVSLQAGNNFNTQRGSDGTLVNWRVVTRLGSETSNADGSLQGLVGDLGANVVLGANIDASPTAAWNGGTGFTPIGNTGSGGFSGHFDGLGHVVSGLNFNSAATTGIGLFGKVESAGHVSNVGSVGVTVRNAGGGTQLAGGLVGLNSGTLSNVFSSGSLSGLQLIGGLVGDNQGTIVNAYSTASATGIGGSTQIGGLAGRNAGTISTTFATGNVSGQDDSGGLVGRHDAGTVSNSFASGTVTNLGGSHVGNLIGDVNAGATLTSSAGGIDATSAAPFAAFDTVDTWTQNAGFSTPLLNAFLQPVTVSTVSGTKVYDGTVNAAPGSIRLSVPGATLLGTLVYTHASASVGSYSSLGLAGLYSNQLGYRIVYGSAGGLTITPAPLSVIGAAAANKVYDAGTAATLTGGTLSGVIAGDAVGLLAGSATFANKNAGTGKAVTATYALTGASQGNYVLTQPTGLTANITPATLTANGITASNKVYDGGVAATVSSGTLAGVLGSDAVSLSIGAASFADKNAAAGKTVTANLSIAGADAGNYTLATPAALTADITRATIRVGGITAASKVYDGQVTATVSAAPAGAVAGDRLTVVSLDATFADANVGTGKLVTGSFTLTGADAGNYTLADGGAGRITGDITQRASVRWVGGSAGDWLTASNWADGAVPTLANVANVIIPAGTVVTLAGTTAANAPSLNSLAGGGLSLAQAQLRSRGAVALDSLALGSGSELNAGSVAVQAFQQTGGKLVIDGGFAVNGAFTQSAGTVKAGGAATVTQTVGDLTVTHLVSNGLTLTSAGDLAFTNLGSTGDATLHAAGRITENAGGSLTALGQTGLAAGGAIRLDEARNMVVGAVAATGTDVTLRQGLGDLTLGTVGARGDLTVTAAAGHVRQLEGTALAVTGNTRAASATGSVYLSQPGNAFGGEVSASGVDVAVTQAGGSTLTLGTVDASRNLAIVSDGEVRQTGKLTVAGSASIDAGTRTVVLDAMGNDFAGAVSARTGALTLVDGFGGLLLGTVTTAGPTVVQSLDGSINSLGATMFLPLGAAIGQFSASVAGTAVPVFLNTGAAVVLNGLLTGGTSIDSGATAARTSVAMPQSTDPGLRKRSSAEIEEARAAVAVPVRE